MACAMLDESGTPHTLWGEATHTTMNILNKAHIWVNNDKTPYELWFCKPPAIKHFRVFGRKSYIKNNYNKLRKFESRADEEILLGYSSRRKGYNFYNKRLQKIVECIDFVIDEVSTDTKREAPVDDKRVPTTRQKDAGEGNNEALEEGIQSTKE